MSISIVKSQIDNFLKSKTPEVMAIKGAWGVGKTYSWNKFLIEARDAKRIGLNRYSYVSLFGVDSLEEFKFLMFQQVVRNELIGTEPNIKTFKANADGLAESFGRKSMQFFGSMPWLKNFSPAIKSLSFLSLQKTLICIDDFERKGANLDTRDAMGLISVLKEQKACKVVLILNDESFKDENLSEYKTFREKVIDLELSFNPTPEECANIALDGKIKAQDHMKKFSSDLGIANIRIIRKAQRLAEIMEQLLSKYEEEITHQALRSLMLFTWCFYSSHDDVPDFNYVKNIGYKLYGILDKKELSEKEKKWNSILQNYKYRNTDEFDLQIAMAVRTGFVHEEEFLTEAKKRNSQVIHQKSEGSFHDAWELYRNTFANNQEEIIKELYESFKKNVKYISPTNLNGTVEMFRALGEEDLADEIINIYIQKRREEKEIFDLDNNYFGVDITDTKIMKEFSLIHEANRDERTLKDVLLQISGKDGWNPADEDILANTSIEDYYNLFKHEEGEHLSSYVNTCLRFGRYKNASEKQQRIGTNATEALKRIAKESPINKRRVAMFGIIEEGDEANANA